MIPSEFFKAVRKAFGPLDQPQVDGFNILLFAARNMTVQHAAYVLATAWHETARTMQPIAEYGKGKGKPYGKVDQTGKAPYGRGYVQLTWRDNYIKADKRLGLSGTLAANYDLAMRPQIAADVIVRGMAEGWFTGKRLADYDNYVAMRRVVNGLDRAELIAAHAYKFESALEAMGKPVPVPPPTPLPPDLPDMESPPEAKSGASRGLLRAILDLIAALFARR